MDIIPDKRKVVGLVEQAHQGKICLPNFQRDFVWSREEVADLVRSIVRRYFIGSLLLLRCDPANPPFAPIFLRGSKSPYQDPRPEYLILDGQQRLSSLIYALTAPDLSLKDSGPRRWFFLNLDVLLDDPDSDNIVFDRSHRELGGLDTRETQFAQRMLPCTELLSAERFYKWRDEFEDWQKENAPEAIGDYRSKWREGWTSAVSAFQTFEVVLIELPRIDESDSESIGRVCAIFEKLNSTGVDLSVYDLLTARLYRSGIRLHDLWDEACKQHPRLRQWSGGKADSHKFGVLALRTLALLRGLDPKPRILIDLAPVGFEDDWRRSVAAIERALELITHVGADGFGVFNEKWLPGFGLVPILAALRAEIDDRKLGDDARAELRRWYWCNVFMERYSSAVESKSRKDYLEMTGHWFDGGPDPEVFQEADNWIGTPGFRVRTSASYASAVYSGVFCLLALRSARDWRRGESIELQDLQDHHIFPQAYLKRHGITKRAGVNTIANRTLISDETNRKISDRAPAGYVDDPGILSRDRAAELLAPHFIGDATKPLMQSATETLSDTEAATLYERFLQAREAAMIAEIRRVCGISPNSVIAAVPEPADELAPDIAAREESDDESSDDMAVPPPLLLTPLNEARQGLFAEILEGVNAKRPAIRVPARNRDSWVTFASGPFGGWSIAQINDGRIRVEAYLDCGDRDRNKALFDELERDRAGWEGKVGFELTFERLDDKRACRVAAHHLSVDLRADMEPGQRRQIVDWGVASLVAMIDTLNLHLRERAKALRDHVPPAGSFTDDVEIADFGPNAESSFVGRLARDTI